VGKTIFKEQIKIPLPEKGGETWQREGGKKEVIPDNMTPHYYHHPFSWGKYIG
jgi:hypothetical protein